MQSLLRQFWLICTFKQNPAILPYSIGLLCVVVLASIMANTHLNVVMQSLQLGLLEQAQQQQQNLPDNFAADYIELLKQLSPMDYALNLCLVALIALALLWTLFSLLKKNNRFVKVAIAMFGVSLICYLCFLGIYLIAQLLSLPMMAILSAIVGVKLWNGVIEIFIFKQALEINWGMALLTTIAFEFVQINVLGLIG